MKSRERIECVTMDGRRVTQSSLGADVNRGDAERERPPLRRRRIRPRASASASACSIGKFATERGRYAYAVRCPLISAADAAAARDGSTGGTLRARSADARRRELENHEPRARRQHAMHFAQARDRGRRRFECRTRRSRPTRGIVGEREIERVGDDRRHRPTPAPCRRRRAASARRNRRRSPGPAKPVRRASSRRTSSVPAQRSTYVPVGVALPAERGDRLPAPGPVDVEAEEMIEQIVARRDLRKDALHVRALRLATGGGRLRLRRLQLADGHRRKVPGRMTVEASRRGWFGTRARVACDDPARRMPMRRALPGRCPQPSTSSIFRTPMSSRWPSKGATRHSAS